MLPSPSSYTVGTPETVISELNTEPMHTPANASPRHRWSSRHSSGPERIANPYSVEDLALKPHLLLHAGFNRRFLDVPMLPSGGFNTADLRKFQNGVSWDGN